MANAFNLLERFEGHSSQEIADEPQADCFSYLARVHVAPCAAVMGAGLRDVLAQLVAADGFDLSQSGLTFHLPDSPTSKNYLIQLGEMPKAILVLSEVKRVQEGYWNRTRQFRVACQFLERIPS